MRCLVDLFRAVMSAPQILPGILLDFIPYALVVAAFAAFVVWNGGIVLGKIVLSLGDSPL